MTTRSSACATAAVSCRRMTWSSSAKIGVVGGAVDLYLEHLPGESQRILGARAPAGCSR